MFNFLKCQWRKIAMVNYAADPALFKTLLPFKTELDLRNDVCYVSLVGFMFLDTVALGLKIPFHINFEEVNLRFYVRHRDGDGVWKRGVVFIKELVPLPMLAFTARSLYGENYVSMPMKHKWEEQGGKISVMYAWKTSQWNSIDVTASAEKVSWRPESEEEFIFEHYWGYTRIQESKTFEYRVDHPVWEVYPVLNHHVNVKFREVYGEKFRFLEQQKPMSVFLAEGSEVTVKSRRVI